MFCEWKQIICKNTIQSDISGSPQKHYWMQKENRVIHSKRWGKDFKPGILDYAKLLFKSLKKLKS